MSDDSQLGPPTMGDHEDAARRKAAYGMPPELHALTFDEMVDRIREPLAELEAELDGLNPAVRTFVVNMRAALDRYDEARQ